MKTSTMNPTKFEKGQIKFYCFLIPMAVFMGMPIVYIINHAFKPLSELFAFPPRFFARNPTLDNFSRLVQAAQATDVSAFRYIFNSFIVTASVVLLTVTIGSLAGFAFSKLQFKGKNLLFEMNTLALMFVPAAVMIPRYLIIDRLGVMDTYFAHMLPILAMPVGLFLLKQFIDQVPDELVEAATIDGAGMLRVYYKVVLPLIRPAVATVAILSFQQVWGNVETSNLFVTKESMRTLTFYMNNLANANTAVAGQGIAAAASLIMFLPNILLFILLQSKVMNTMAHSGMK